MNAHALSILELSRILVHVSQRAHSSPGVAAVRALAPSSDQGWLESEHQRVSAMRTLITGEPAWTAEQIPDLAAPLTRLRVEGVSWTAPELLQGATFLRSTRRTREALRDVRRNAVARAVLQPFGDQLIEARAIEDAIARAINDDGSVRDDASPALRKIRQELRRAEGELVRLLEREMSKLESHHQVSDASVTMRNGRWVMPVRREARVVVGGLVHDTSGTGATIFVEPPAAVEFGNRLRELEIDEQREIERILREITALLHPLYQPLRDAFAAMVALDSLLARARYAEDVHAGQAEFGPASSGCEFVHARHPLLLAQGINVVPFTLALDAGERTLLVSGPNTGGKTVLLKAIGLLAVMAQCGVPVPVAGGSRLPVFDDVFADVGDEQSLEASLSTFSAHLKHQGEILRLATHNSLVLMDEVGSGTDPAEGAALGGAILETLTRRGAMTVATTHLGALKLLATEVPGVVNASLQFDAALLAPTYRLIKGVPGRSYGISIARRLQLPEHVLTLAESRLPTGERDLALLLADVEAREATLAERELEADREARRIASRIATVSDREKKAREKEKELERSSRQEARKYLLEARAEVERAIGAVKAAAADAQISAEMIDAKAREARRAVEEAASGQQQAVAAMDARAAQSRSQRRAGLAPAKPASGGGSHQTEKSLAAGDAVLVGTLGDKAGTVVDVRGTSVRVLVGSLTLAVPINTLTRTAAPPPPAVRVPVMGDVPEVDPVREVDLRGMRVDELEIALMQALDAAVRNDLRELRIIHGKGTGALRERVGEMLRGDSRVATHRLGGWNEGGAGVTLAELR